MLSKLIRTFRDWLNTKPRLQSNKAKELLADDQMRHELMEAIETERSHDRSHPPVRFKNGKREYTLHRIGQVNRNKSS